MKVISLYIFCLLYLQYFDVGVSSGVTPISEEERVPCGFYKTKPRNETECNAIGSCIWNASSVTHKCYTRRKKGKCMLYKGGACAQSLNSTLPAYRNTPRFFDDKYGQVYTEIMLKEIVNLIDQGIEDKKCRYILKNLFCHYTLTPCKPDGKTVLPFCKEDCVAIFRQCAIPLQQAVGFVTVLIIKERVNFVHTGLPNCSIYKYEKELDPKKNETCIKTGFFNYTPESIAHGDDGDRNSLIETVLPIVLVLVVALIVVVLLLFWMRSKKKRQALMNSKMLAFAGSGTMTMRERLKADSMRSIDSRLLRLFDPEKLKQYPLDEVEYVKDLGEGHFGKVYHGRAINLLPEEPTKVISIAVKALKEGSNKETKDEFFREVTLMSILNHPNIVRLLAVCTEEEPYGMIFEFMKDGDLNQYLRSAKPAEKSLDDPEVAKVYLTQEDLLSASVQIALGMEYLARLRFVHRDLATRNCLVGEDFVIKIADFGMSRDLYSSDYYKMTHESLLPVRWLSPEAFMYGKFTIKSDVYAYGVCLWEIYTFGLQPYYGYANKEVAQFIQKGIHLGKPENCPDHVYALMKSCWAWEPSDRPDFTTIGDRLKDPYGNYDRPAPVQKTPSTDSIDAVETNFGNYDIPRGHLENYDRPKSGSENYDTPLRGSRELIDDSSKSPLDMPVKTPPVEGHGDEKYGSSISGSPNEEQNSIRDNEEHKLESNEEFV